MREKRLGYVDLNSKELKSISYAQFVNVDGLTMHGTLKSKTIVKNFCNKLNKAKVYEVILREVKK